MLYLAAILYAVIFWAVTWSRPQLALLLIFALAPFQNDLSMGGPMRFSIAEVNLLLALPIFIIQGRPWKLGPLTAAIGSYIAICIFSSMLQWRQSALLSLLQIILYLVIAVVIFRSLPRQTSQYGPALSGLLLTCCALSIAVLAARSGYVMGLHKNGTGGSLACGLIACTELWFSERDAIRRQCLLGALALIAAGLIFTLSRGAWLTAALGILVILSLRREFRTMLRAGVVFIALALICWGRLTEESRAYASAFERENFNIRARYESMDFALNEFWKAPLLGTGVGLRKEYDATNVIFLTLAETGVAGLIALGAVHLGFLRCVWRTRRALPLNHPNFPLITIGLALLLGKMAHGLVDHYWGRGDLMITWAAAGMALRAYDARRGAAKKRAQVYRKV